MKKINVVILGTGRVGQTLGYFLQRSRRYQVKALWNRTLKRARQAAKFIGGPIEIKNDPVRAARAGEIIFITTSDGVIKKICDTVAFHNGFTSSRLVLHCSGNFSSAILKSARKLAGVQIGSCHPLQTFARPSESVKNFSGTYCSYEGTRRALPEIKSLIKNLKGIPVKINPDQKPLYHIAGVIISNYLVTLLEGGQRFLRRAGFPEKITLPAVKPLVEGTLKNIYTMGINRALTGPIARGDIVTVKNHLRLIQRKLPHYLPFYVEMGKMTIRIARRKGTLGISRCNTFKKMFNYEYCFNRISLRRKNNGR